jgi:hypothetical protein
VGGSQPRATPIGSTTKAEQDQRVQDWRQAQESRGMCVEVAEGSALKNTTAVFHAAEP